MTWGNKSNYNTTYLDAAGDSPADARPELKNAVDELTNVIDGLGTKGGAVKMESDGTISANVSTITTTTGDLTLSSNNSTVAISYILNLTPKTKAQLDSLGGDAGDVAVCSNGNAGGYCLAVYNGSAWLNADGDALATS